MTAMPPVTDAFSHPVPSLRACVAGLALAGAVLAGGGFWAAANTACAAEADGEPAAAESESEAFSVEVDGVELWFTPTGAGEVAVGRGNEARGDAYAVDAAYSGAVAIPAQVEHGGQVFSVTAVQDYAFSNGSDQGCALAALELPASVRSIGSSAFMSCSNLAAVSFAADGELAYIGTSAFQRCFALKEVLIPASVEVVDDYAFAYCTGLESAVFAEGSRIQTLGNGAFRCNAKLPGSLKTFVYPAVDTIASYVLSFQVELQSLTFAGESYAYLETEALRGCSSLTYLEIPQLTGAKSALDQPARLQVMCVAECTSLKTVVFKGDAGDYIAWALSDEQHPFYNDASIETVVWCGTAWGGSTSWGAPSAVSSQVSSGPTNDLAKSSSSVAALFAFNPNGVEQFVQVSFYASAEAEEAGEEPLGVAYLRSDVTPAALNAGTVADEQVWQGSAADLPVASGSWAFADYGANEAFAGAVSAYDAAANDLGGCAVELQKTGYIEGLEDVAPACTVTAPDGSLLEEGVDYTLAYQVLGDDGEPVEVAADELGAAGSYRVVASGRGAWEGQAVAHFSVVAADLEAGYLGASDVAVAAGVSAALYEAGRGGTAVLVSDDDPRWLLAAIPAAVALDAPVLLTSGDALSEEAASELRRLEAASVVVVGDQDVMTEDLRADLAALRTSPSVSRIAVATPEAASLQLYRQFVADDTAAAGADTAAGADASSTDAAEEDAALGTAGTAYVVAGDTGELGAAALALVVRTGSPVFLAAADGTLDGATRNLLKTTSFAQVEVLAATEEAVQNVAWQVGNDAVAFQGTVGSLDELALQALEDALESGTSTGAVVACAAGDATEALLAALYAAQGGLALAVCGDAAVQDDDPAADAALAALASHAAQIESLDFATAPGGMSVDQINAFLATWGAELDLSVFTAQF